MLLVNTHLCSLINVRSLSRGPTRSEKRSLSLSVGIPRMVCAFLCGLGVLDTIFVLTFNDSIFVQWHVCQSRSHGASVTLVQRNVGGSFGMNQNRNQKTLVLVE